jgi:hypothetical protein
VDPAGQQSAHAGNRAEEPLRVERPVKTLEQCPPAGGEHLVDGRSGAGTDSGQALQSFRAAAPDQLTDVLGQTADCVGSATKRAHAERIGPLPLEKSGRFAQAGRDRGVLRL